MLRRATTELKHFQTKKTSVKSETGTQNNEDADYRCIVCVLRCEIKQRKIHPKRSVA